MSFDLKAMIKYRTYCMLGSEEEVVVGWCKTDFEKTIFCDVTRHRHRHYHLGFEEWSWRERQREREILNPTWSWGWGGCFMTPQGDEWTLLEGSLFAFVLTTSAPRPGKSWGYCLVGDIKHGIEDSMYWITWLGVKAKYSLVKKKSK